MPSSPPTIQIDITTSSISKSDLVEPVLLAIRTAAFYTTDVSSISLSEPTVFEPVPVGLPNMSVQLTTAWVDVTVTKTVPSVVVTVTGSSPTATVNVTASLTSIDTSMSPSQTATPTAFSTSFGMFSFDPTSSVNKGVNDPPATTGLPWTSDQSAIASSASAFVSSENAAASSVASVAASQASSVIGSLTSAASTTSTSGAMRAHSTGIGFGGLEIAVVLVVAVYVGRVLRGML